MSTTPPPDPPAPDDSAPPADGSARPADGSARPADDFARPADDSARPADDELLAVLQRAALAFDAPPAALTAANKELLSWRDPDAALAELVADSRELAGAARGPGDEVILRFDAAGASIVVQVEPSGAGDYLLLGQVEPASGAPAGTVALRRPGTETTVSCDEWGRFRLEGVAPGPARFRWTPAASASAPLDTAWTLI